MIPYSRQNIDAGDIQSVVDVLRSDFITQGPLVPEFERALARYCGAKYAVVVSNGTTALHLAYLAAGLRVGDEVITTPNTFVATSNMALAVGAKPVFCDIRPDTWNIDESKIERLITPKTKAVVPVHFAGHPCEMDEIYKVARRRKLRVIEDACHALGARHKKSRIGGCRFSDMAVFSFHPVKAITTGEGGAVLTNNKKLREKILLLRNHGIRKDAKVFNVMTELGYNCRMTDIQAALGLSQMQKLDKFLRARNEVASRYNRVLADIPEIQLPAKLPENYSGWHIYVIHVKNAKLRQPLPDFVRKSGIGVNFHYPQVYSHPYYRQMGYRTRLKNADIHHAACLTLPCYPGLGESDIDRVAGLIKKFLLSMRKSL